VGDNRLRANISRQRFRTPAILWSVSFLNVELMPALEAI
jgi:hypothetical protein